MPYCYGSEQPSPTIGRLLSQAFEGAHSLEHNVIHMARRRLIGSNDKQNLVPTAREGVAARAVRINPRTKDQSGLLAKVKVGSETVRERVGAKGLKEESAFVRWAQVSESVGG